MCGEEHAGHFIRMKRRHSPASAHGRLLDDLVVVGSALGSAGVQRRTDGLLHDVNPAAGEADS
jgi:hypothetical protein